MQKVYKNSKGEKIILILQKNEFFIGANETFPHINREKICNEITRIIGWRRNGRSILGKIDGKKRSCVGFDIPRYAINPKKHIEKLLRINGYSVE